MTEIDQNPERVALPGERVRARKTGELLADDLRRRIVRGELREGDALPSEAELMVRFGVSRPTLREALRVLESESLITVRAGLPRSHPFTGKRNAFGSLVDLSHGCARCGADRRAVALRP